MASNEYNTYSSINNNIENSFFGLGRAFFVGIFNHPLEVIKTRQQIQEKASWAHQVAIEIFKQEGPKGFFRGFSSQFAKIALKQMWCWPLIIGIPNSLEKRGVDSPLREIGAGVTISTLDTALTTPFENGKLSKLLKIDNNGKKFSHLYAGGWSGIRYNWTKLTVVWCTFLTAQKLIRENEKKRIDSTILPLKNLIIAGIETAFVVCVVSAPFDHINSHRLNKNMTIQNVMQKMLASPFRGAPLNLLMLTTHTVASIILIEFLEPN